jgi:hypothetical protein
LLPVTQGLALTGSPQERKSRFFLKEKASQKELTGGSPYRARPEEEESHSLQLANSKFLCGAFFLKKAT